MYFSSDISAIFKRDDSKHIILCSVEENLSVHDKSIKKMEIHSTKK